MGRMFNGKACESGGGKDENPYLDRVIDLDARISQWRQEHIELVRTIRQVNLKNDVDNLLLLNELNSELIGIESIGRALVQERNSVVIMFEAHETKSSTPPLLGERLLLLILTKEERTNIPGDLAEEFTEIAAKHGERFARVWYYKQVAASAWPLVRRALKWGLLASFGAWLRRLI